VGFDGVSVVFQVERLVPSLGKRGRFSFFRSSTRMDEGACCNVTRYDKSEPRHLHLGALIGALFTRRCRH
jgi:hypothetical protein